MNTLVYISNGSFKDYSYREILPGELLYFHQEVFLCVTSEKVGTWFKLILFRDNINSST